MFLKIEVNYMSYVVRMKAIDAEANWIYILFVYIASICMSFNQIIYSE